MQYVVIGRFCDYENEAHVFEAASVDAAEKQFTQHLHAQDASQRDNEIYIDFVIEAENVKNIHCCM